MKTLFVSVSLVAGILGLLLGSAPFFTLTNDPHDDAAIGMVTIAVVASWFWVTKESGSNGTKCNAVEPVSGEINPA